MVKKKAKEMCTSEECACHGSDQGYCGCHMWITFAARILFVLGLIFALNTMPFMANVPWWAELLFAVGFVFMKKH